MIAALLLVALSQQTPVRGLVTDAVLGTPVIAALVRSPRAETRSDGDGRFVIEARAGDTLRVRRVGYRQTSIVVRGDSVMVRLTPIATALSTVRITDSVVPGRMTVSRSVAELQERGLVDVGAAIAAMPFVTARSARGESTLSMRGARPEQVLVLLDGMPLNDPATGRADVADIPLAALGAITVAPGASAADYGSGASGGVVALGSSTGTSFALHGSSLQGVGIEGAVSAAAASARLRVGGSLASARNAFRFLNDAGAKDTIEVRENADERRGALFLSALRGPLQITALYAAVDRGLVGPKNVRAYDRASERSDRLLARARVGSDRWLMSGGVRRLALRYSDAARPELNSESYSTVVDLDGQLSMAALVLRAGFARDHVWGSSLPEADRPSAYASGAVSGRRADLRIVASARVDAVRRAGAHLSPSLLLEREGRVTPFLRVGQGFRLPTFYDLYAPSPLGFIPTRVAPERVVLDAEAGLRTRHRRTTLSASLFERRTHNAIIWFPGNFSWSPKNVASERVRGLESRVATSTARWATEAWGALYDTRLFAEGIHVPTPYVPRLSGGATSQLALGRASVTTQLSARGRRPFAVAAPARVLELPGVVLADLHASYRASISGRETLLTAGVVNIGNTRFESVRRFPTPGRVWQAAITVRP